MKQLSIVSNILYFKQKFKIKTKELRVFDGTFEEGQRCRERKLGASTLVVILL